MLGSGLLDNLGDEEMVSVIGHDCGHIQNNHTAYLTTLYLLDHAGNFVVRWAARPAVLALHGWSRRAEITCDRASLICTPQPRRHHRRHGQAGPRLAPAVQRGQRRGVPAAARRDPGRARPLRGAAGHQPYLPKRVKALRIFAQTTFYKSVLGEAPRPEDPGLTREACDAQVGELLQVLG